MSECIRGSYNDALYKSTYTLLSWGIEPHNPLTNPMNRYCRRLSTRSYYCMRTVLSYCNHFASQCSLDFDANKSKCILFLPRGKRRTCKPVFVVHCHSVEYVDEYVHLDHVIFSQMDDARDIDICRLALIRQINSVLYLFGQLYPVVKMQLLISYCYSLYGSVT